MRLLASVAALALLAGCGGDENSEPQPPPIALPGTPGAPSFTSALGANAPENVASGQSFYQATATDPNNDPITYSIVGGADAGQFAITTAGALSFTRAPDFEAPTDANRDNIYELQLQASDGTLTTRVNLLVTVTDQADGSPSAIRLQRVAAGLTFTTQIVPIANDPRVLVLGQGGQVSLLDPRAPGSVTDYINIPGAVSIAAATDFATSGRIYATIAVRTGGAGLTGGTSGFEVLRFSRGPNGVGDPASRDVILKAEYTTDPSAGEPQAFGAEVVFGPDGLLYILSAEGAVNGPFAAYPSQAGNLASLFGKVLRIDVSADSFPSDPNRDYAIPAGNPALGSGTAQEIYAFGLADPSGPVFEGERLFFMDEGVPDPRTGDPAALAELNLLTSGEAGRSYGWPGCEGLRPFRSGSCAGTIPPIAVFAGDRSVRLYAGGTYNGNQTTLRGLFLFARTALVSTSPGDLWTISANTPVGTTRQGSEIVCRRADLTPDVGSIGTIGGIGRDAAGNIYVFDADVDGEIFLAR